MAPRRRQGDENSAEGITAVLLVVAESGDPSTLAAACRQALRETDAVLERQAAGVISVLLRHVRGGRQDTLAVADRLRRACETATGAPTEIAVAVAAGDDEPLDLLMRRAEEDLALQAVDPPR